MKGGIDKVFPNLGWEHEAGCLTLYLAAGPGWDASYYSALLKDVVSTWRPWSGSWPNILPASPYSSRRTVPACSR